MSSLFKKSSFYLTPLDKQIFDPETGAFDDITLWAKLYFDIDVFPWQSYFYHYPCNDKMVVAGIRTGKSKGASLFMLHLAQFNPGVRILNTSISSEQAKIVYHDMLEVITTIASSTGSSVSRRAPIP
jgi:hypothetical protein